MNDGDKAAQLLGYALGALPEAEQVALGSTIESDPALAAVSAQVQELTASIRRAAGRPSAAPGLAERTLANLAVRLTTATVPASGPTFRAYPALSSDGPTTRSGSRKDVIAIVALLLLTFGITLPTLLIWRQEERISACKNNLRMLHNALGGYADTHHDRLPQITETGPYATAGSFLPQLAFAGQLPEGVRAICPWDAQTATWGEIPKDGPKPSYPSRPYAYNLGYREGRELVGLKRGSAIGDQFVPIIADCPPKQANPADTVASAGFHRTGMNVLFVSGEVRFSSHAQVGPGNDPIFTNTLGLVRAGIGQGDSVLGSGADQP